MNEDLWKITIRCSEKGPIERTKMLLLTIVGEPIIVDPIKKEAPIH